MLQQVSIFTANRQGALSRMTSILAKETINIYTMLANDSAEFGIVRLIVDKPEEAVLILEKEGYQCRVDLVIAVDMGSDKPGALDRILGDLQAANVMIRYLYISFDRATSSPIAVSAPPSPRPKPFSKEKVTS